MESNIKKYRISDLVLIGAYPTWPPNMYNSNGLGDRGIVLEASDCQGEWHYALFVEGMGHCAWYWHSQLTLLARNQAEMLEQWEQRLADQRKQQSELPWIFERYSRGEGLPGDSVQALATCLGLGSLWGSNGEGITYYTRAMLVMTIAKPFLVAKDLAGWLVYCELFKKTRAERKETP